MHPIFERFKERKIVQWALAYVAGAVALYSALDAFAEPWGVGDFQLRITQVLLLVGFFVAVTLAWYHGERGEQRVSGAELLILAGIMGLGAIGLRSVWGSPRNSVAEAEATRTVRRVPNPFLPGEAPTRPGFLGHAFSPDGRLFVYQRDAVRSDGRTDLQDVDGSVALYVRRWSDDLSSSRIEGTVGGQSPSVSPDGEEVAFNVFVNEKWEIRIAALLGERARLLAPGVRPHWGEDGFVYATDEVGLYRVDPSADAPPEYLARHADATAEPGRWGVTMGDLLPGARQALIWVNDQSSGDEIRVLDLETGEQAALFAGARPRYVNSGHLIFWRPPATMMAVSFDPKRGQVTGAPQALMRNVNAWSLADDGTLIYSRGARSARVDVGTNRRTAQFLRVHRSGTAEPIDSAWTVALGNDETGWRLSPDGRFLAYREVAEEATDLWIRDLETGRNRRFTHHTAYDSKPAWRPGSNELTFLTNRIPSESQRAAPYAIWSGPIDRSRPPEMVVDLRGAIRSFDWGPDGEWIVFRAGGNAGVRGGRDVYAFRPGEDAAPIPLLADPSYGELNPTISPDGRFLAVQTNASGRDEIEVRPFPAVESGRWYVSVEGGRNPRWAHSGRELFFQDPQNRMMKVDVSLEDEFTVGQPEVLFEAEDDWIWIDLFGVYYDVAPDDQSFIVAKLISAGDEGRGEDWGLVENFALELSRLVPN